MKYIKDGKFSNCKAIELNGRWISNPTEEQIRLAGWVEYVPPTAEPYTPTYEERVEELIRERYTISEEFAILRQRDTKAEEFAEYFAYCEDCKARAKAEE